MLPWQPELQPNQPKNLMQPFPYLIMLYMKFENWQIDFRDIDFYEKDDVRPLAY